MTRPFPSTCRFPVSYMVMKALVQRVSEASVTVGNSTAGSIGRGFLVFLCAMKGDTERDLEYLIRKVLNLRIFDDSEGKMNLSLSETGGECLVVSQFTLAARTRRGNRPSFDDAESPDRAEEMYHAFINGLASHGVKVETGVFGAHMEVSLVNDGPVTILIDSRQQR